jgi:uncharacterized protein (TIGR04255 family)
LRPFVTPLHEVSAEINLASQQVAEFRGRSFYAGVAADFPQVHQFPLIFVPPESITPEQLAATPAIYRFSSADAQRSIFIGTRMVAANTTSWPGYPAYKKFASDVVSRYTGLHAPCTVERHSIGFYNRIPVASIDELREVVDASFDLRGDVALFELVAQSARMTAAGSVLTQLFMQPPDAITTEPFLAINNIIRSNALAGAFDMERWLTWLDLAHDEGRDAIWNILSAAAKESWSAANADK